MPPNPHSSGMLHELWQPEAGDVLLQMCQCSTLQAAGDFNCSYGHISSSSSKGLYLAPGTKMFYVLHNLCLIILLLCLNGPEVCQVPVLPLSAAR